MRLHAGSTNHHVKDRRHKREHQQHQTGQREPGGRVHEVQLEPPAVNHSVKRGRRYQQGRGSGAQHQGHAIDVSLEIGGGAEPRLECQREQEREQDLHARLGYPYLLEYLAVGAVGPLQRRFTPLGGIPLIVIMNRRANPALVTKIGRFRVRLPGRDMCGNPGRLGIFAPIGWVPAGINHSALLPIPARA